MEEYQKNKFWNNYIEQLNKRAIKETAQRWYVIHVEQYVKSIPDKKLKYHTAENVNQYFSSTGRNKSLTGWQFRQWDVSDCYTDLIINRIILNY